MAQTTEEKALEQAKKDVAHEAKQAATQAEKDAKKQAEKDTAEADVVAKQQAREASRAQRSGKGLKVIAVQTGFYPKDVRRRKGSVFVLQKAEHFSDHEQEIVRPAKDDRGRIVLDEKGKPVLRGHGQFGWMAWADDAAPIHNVTQPEAHAALHKSTGDQSVI